MINYITIPGVKGRLKPTPANVLSVVCKIYDVKKDDVLKKTRKRVLVEVRQMCFYFLSMFTNMTLKEIGSFFPQCFDHTTVLHGRERIKDLLHVENCTKEKLNNIKNEFSI